MNKVYVVECSSGTWDDYHSWISGIFTNLNEASKIRDEHLEKAESLKYEYKEKHDLWLHGRSIVPEGERDELFEWIEANENYGDNFNCWVTEYPLNVISSGIKIN